MTSHRENQSNTIVLLMLLVLLSLVLVAGGGVFFWLQSLRAMQAKNEVERLELRAKAAALQKVQEQ